MSKQAITHLQDNKFLASNVRTAYPDIYTAKHFKGDTKNTARFGIVILIPKSDTASHKLIDDHIRATAKEQLKLTKIPAADVCLKDGDESTQAAYAGHWYINAYKYPKDQENLKAGAPDVVDASNPPNRIAQGASNEPLSGDYCDVIFEIYAAPKWKKINGGLSVVRFRRKGDPIGGGNDVAALPEVPDLEEEENDDDEV